MCQFTFGQTCCGVKLELDYTSCAWYANMKSILNTVLKFEEAIPHALAIFISAITDH